METLHEYMTRNVRANVIDFTVRAQIELGGAIKFYIRPAHVSGDTRDFLVWEDPSTGFDMLMPEGCVPKPSFDRVRGMLKAREQ